MAIGKQMSLKRVSSKKLSKSEVVREDPSEKKEKDKKDKKKDKKEDKKEKKEKKKEEKKDKKGKKKDKKDKGKEKEEDGMPSSTSAPSGSSSSVPLTSSAPAPSKAASTNTLPEDDIEAKCTSVVQEKLGVEKNSILISIISAKGLKNMEMIGKSDPYVKVRVMDRSGVKAKTFKTKTKSSNLNPEYNENFMFVFPFGTGVEDYILEMEVYDEDTSKDTFMGMCSQGMMEIMGDDPGRVVDIKLEAKKTGQNVKGTLQCAVRFPTSEEIEEMGAGFTGKVAKALVNYITYSCADAVAKLKPDAAIFECEAEVTVFNIVFIYVLNILIPLGSPTDLFEIKKDMALNNLEIAVRAKSSSKAKTLVKSVPKDAQKIIANFMPKFLDQVTPILNASRRAPPSGGGETQMGIGVKPIIHIPPPPAPTVVGAEIALKVIFASMPKGAPPPPPTVFSAMALAENQSARHPSTLSSPVAATPAPSASKEEPQARLPPSLLADQGYDSDDEKDKKKKKKGEGEEGWIPQGENIGMLDVVNNSVIIRVEDVKGLQHKTVTGGAKPYVLVTVTDRSGSLAKKFKTNPIEGQDVSFDKDFLYIIPFGRTIDDFVANFSVFHSSITGKKFLGQCERPIVDIMGSNPGETAEMQLQPKKQGDFVKGSCSFSVRKPTDDDIETIGTSVSSKITRHLVSYILYSCADAIVKGATLPSCVRFECEAEITVFNICFIFILSISIPYGAPASTFETGKDIAFENLQIGVATKGVPKLFAKVPDNSRKMVDSYLPRFMEQLMIIVEGARKPMEGNRVYMELGVGMKPSFSLPFPPNPPVLTGEIAFRVFLGTGGRDEISRAIPNSNYAAITNRDDEMKQRDDSAQVLVAEAKAGAAEENGSVIISVTKATKLRSVNITGKSDPFVKVKIMETNGAKVKKYGTEVIKNKVNPVWDEKFLCVFPFNKTSEDLILQLMVYDKGLSGNTFLGKCEQSMANILRDDCGKQIEMQLQPKKKGDNVKGSIEFSVRPTTPKDLEDMGADTASRLARALISYIAFSFANAIVKMKPKNARFEVEAEFTVFGMCFIFCATVVIPLGTKPDAFEMKRDQAYDLLQVCVDHQSKKFMQKIPKNAKSMLNSFLPRFMEQCAPLLESSRKPDEQKIQAQTGIGIKPEFALPFPPAPAVISGSVALRAIFGLGGDVSAAPFRGFAFHQTLGPVANDELRKVPGHDDEENA